LFAAFGFIILKQIGFFSGASQTNVHEHIVFSSLTQLYVSADGNEEEENIYKMLFVGHFHVLVLAFWNGMKSNRETAK
jgi:hypothetical protein